MFCFIDTVTACLSFCSKFRNQGKVNDASLKLPQVPHMNIFSLCCPLLSNCGSFNFPATLLFVLKFLSKDLSSLKVFVFCCFVFIFIVSII